MPPLNKLQRNCLAIAVSQAIALPIANAATITVGTSTDALGAASCSLRDAIISVNNDVLEANCTSSGAGTLDIIDFAGSVNTINLSSGLPGITQGVTINGPGEASLTISGSLSHRVFDFNSSNVTVNNLTISQASGVGAGFRSQSGSDVILDSITISDGTASDGAAGMGFFTSNTTLNNCTITNNSAARYGGGLAVGVGATMTLNNTDVTNNDADYGAGIFVTTNGVLNINSDSNISMNSATLRGGGIYSNEGSVDINQSQISANKTYNGTSAGYQNGGAGIYAKSSTLTIDSASIISNNIANNSANLPYGVDGYGMFISGLSVKGGGINLYQSPSANINNTTISGNSSTGNGGGIYARSSSFLMISDSTISQNSSPNSGAGIKLSSSPDAVITNSTFEYNIANVAAAISASSSSGRLKIAGSTISNNTTTSGRGAGVTLDNSPTSTIENSTISNNSAIGGSFGGGAGLYLRNTHSITVSNSTISNNNANNRGAAFFIVSTNSVLIENSKIENNNAGTSGAGIHVEGSNNLIINDTTFTANINTGEDGGAINADNAANLQINRSTFTDNNANYGGAIHAFQSSDFELNNSTLYSNKADNTGGAILTNGSHNFTIRNSTISGNSAVVNGGGIHPISSNSFSIVNTIIANTYNVGDCYRVGSTIISDTNSIIEDGSCNAAGIGARTGDPSLLPLADNGGSTKTMALRDNSIAVNTGDNATCLATDQRGDDRAASVDDACDVGAFELKPSSFYVVPLPNGKAVIFGL